MVDDRWEGRSFSQPRFDRFFRCSNHDEMHRPAGPAAAVEPMLNTMQTFCRYFCAVVVIVGTSLTPSSCDEIDDIAQKESQTYETPVIHYDLPSNTQGKADSDVLISGS